MRYWVVDAPGHRAETAKAPQFDLPPGFDPASVIVVAPPPECWICDVCNDDITVRMPNGEPCLVPLDDQTALCLACARRAGYLPGHLSSWSQDFCGCRACVSAAAGGRGLHARLPELAEMS